MTKAGTSKAAVRTSGGRARVLGDDALEMGVGDAEGGRHLVQGAELLGLQAAVRRRHSDRGLEQSLLSGRVELRGQGTEVLRQGAGVGGGLGDHGLDFLRPQRATAVSSIERSQRLELDGLCRSVGEHHEHQRALDGVVERLAEGLFLGPRIVAKDVFLVGAFAGLALDVLAEVLEGNEGDEVEGEEAPNFLVVVGPLLVALRAVEETFRQRRRDSAATPDDHADLFAGTTVEFRLEGRGYQTAYRRCQPFALTNASGRDIIGEEKAK